MSFNPVSIVRDIVSDTKDMSTSEKVGLHGTSIGVSIMNLGACFKSGQLVVAGAIVAVNSLILSKLLETRSR